MTAIDPKVYLCATCAQGQRREKGLDGWLHVAYDSTGRPLRNVSHPCDSCGLSSDGELGAGWSDSGYRELLVTAYTIASPTLSNNTETAIVRLPKREVITEEVGTRRRRPYESYRTTLPVRRRWKFTNVYAMVSVEATVLDTIEPPQPVGANRQHGHGGARRLGEFIPYVR